MEDVSILGMIMRARVQSVLTKPNEEEEELMEKILEEENEENLRSLISQIGKENLQKEINNLLDLVINEICNKSAKIL